MVQQNFQEAKRFLDYAINFTPQYGDSFIELIRLEILQKGSLSANTFEELTQTCVNADPNYGTLWLYCKKHPLDSPRQVLRNAKELLLNANYQHLLSINCKQQYDVSKMCEEDRWNAIFGCEVLNP